jgi:NAD(P)-dependent dehydrogenase (short-subunit alcohol dehydrogenase family)
MSVAIITGGAGDIGAAIGAELVRRGASVTLIDRKSEQEAEGWLARVGEVGSVAYRQADVRDRPALERALRSVDPLDVAIGNTGVVESAPFLEITDEQWRTHLDVNLTGCFNLGQAAARLMVERGTAGRIIFTGSWVQEVPWPEIAAYSASKAGLRMLARSMARELARHRILVNVLAPGIVDAGLARRQLETEPQYARRGKCDPARRAPDHGAGRAGNGIPLLAGRRLHHGRRASRRRGLLALPIRR